MPRGTTLLELVDMQNISAKVVAAHVDNVLCSLDYRLEHDCSVRLLDLTTDDGMRVYRSSLVFVLIRAAREVLPNCRVHIEHALSNGLYGEIEAEQPLVEEDVKRIEKRMMDIILADEPIVRHVLPRDEAIAIFARQNLQDKVKLYSQMPDQEIMVHSCGDYYDTLADVFVPSTGCLLLFKLRFTCQDLSWVPKSEQSCGNSRVRGTRQAGQCLLQKRRSGVKRSASAMWRN